MRVGQMTNAGVGYDSDHCKKLFQKQRKAVELFLQIMPIMKKLCYVALALFCFAGHTFSQSKDYTYRAVPFTSVKLKDNFWLPRIRTNHTVTIPASFERCDKTGRI